MAELPSDVIILTDLTPQNAAEADPLESNQFVYSPPLSQRAGEVALHAPEHLQAIVEARDRDALGAMEHQQRLGEAALLSAAARLVENDAPAQSDPLAEAFTSISCTLYGQPDPLEAGRLLLDVHKDLLAAQGMASVSQDNVTFLLRELDEAVQRAQELPGMTKAQAEAARLLVATQTYGKGLHERFAEIITRAEAIVPKDRLMEPQDFPPIFTMMFRQLAQYHGDDSWLSWQPALDQGDCMATAPSLSRVFIGSGFPPCPWQEGLSYVWHEGFWHVTGAHNGAMLGDPDTATGNFPNYAATEESGGIETEAALDNGQEPDRSIDRYLATAMALGVLDGKQRSRADVYRLSLAHHRVRAQMRNSAPRIIAGLPQAARVLVNRLFDGTPGNIPTGQVQGVLTYDSGYHDRRLAWQRLTARRLVQGETPSTVYDDYRGPGMYDPTNRREVKHLIAGHILDIHGRFTRGRAAA